MRHRILTLLLVCAAITALAACEPKPQPPKAAAVAGAVTYLS
jgi:hypothetical protein